MVCGLYFVVYCGGYVLGYLGIGCDDFCFICGLVYEVFFCGNVF